jgi:hypothetical protein
MLPLTEREHVVPNGLSGLLFLEKEEFQRILSAVPPDTVIGYVVRQPEPQKSPANARQVIQMLHECSSEHVVVENDGFSYIIRLVPSLIYVRPDSKLVKQLKRQHRGALFINRKEDVERMVNQVRPETVIGDVVASVAAQPEVFPVTARELSRTIAESSRKHIPIMELDHSGYLVQVTPRVGIGQDSVLFPELRRRHHDRGHWG